MIWRNRPFLAVSLAVGTTFAGIGMVAPVRVLYAQSRGASLAIIAAMASAFLFSNFAFQYPSGWIADRWGRKRIMVAGLLVQSAISASYLLVSDPLLFILLRVGEGIGSASLLPPARAVIADTVPERGRGEAYGVFSAFFNGGFLLGPAIGGLLAATGYSSAFVASSGVRLLALAVVLALVPGGERARPADEERRAPGAGARLLTLPLLAAYVLSAGDALYLGFDLTLLPLWMRHHLGAPIAGIGFAFALWAIPNMIIAPLGGRVADRTRRSGLILIFGLAQVPIYAVYGLLTWYVPLLVLSTLHGAVYAMVQPAVDAHLAASSPPEARARVQSIYMGVGMASAFVGANTLPLLYTLNFRLPIFTVGAVFGVCIAIGGGLVRLSEQRGISATFTPEPRAIETA